MISIELISQMPEQTKVVPQNREEEEKKNDNHKSAMKNLKRSTENGLCSDFHSSEF